MSAPGGLPREGFSSMKLPSLIKQLKVVLDQYPDDGQILKELIQNAEDADATEVKILYDGRPFSPPSVDGFPHLRTLKGPGLCVYNDGVFTDEDWDGIRMLQSSIKEQEPLKVGRFGLGFKSVFHLTDVPLIVSGHNILLLDPYMWEDDPKMVCYMSRLDRIEFSKDLLLRVLDGIFGFSAQTLKDGFFKGTLFWFPLRGEVTELSDIIYDDNKIQDLFSAFQAEAPHMLLFLKSLSRIQVCQKGASLFGKQVPENSCETLFTVDTSSYVGDTVNIRKEFVESIKELKGGLPKSPIEKIYYMKVETCDFMSTHQNCNNSIWLVIQHFQDGKISKSFKKLCFDKTIASCPCVGLAFALEQEQTGHIFCFLPLPLEAQSPTGLPIHVHGHFALSQNRRHIKWPTADQTKNKSQMDKAIRWNQCLLLEVFPQTYVSLIQELIMYWQKEGRDETCVEKIYRALPDKSQIRENWKGLCEAFYKLMFRERSLYTPNDGGKWINAENGILFVPSKVSSEIQETVVVTYKMSQENIVVVPPHLHEALQSYYPDLDQLKFVTPDGLSKTLQSKNLYPGITDQQKLHLLEFICAEDSFQCLRGVRLLPLADGSFTTFGEADPVFVCEDEDDINMFPGLRHRFVLRDSTTGHYLQDMAKKGMFNIQRLSSEPFARLLKECMEVQFPSGVATVTSDSQFSPEWLDSVWQYITKHDIDVKDKFPDDLLIPGEATADGTMPLYPVSSSFICMNVKTVGDLDQRLGLALEHLGIIPLSKIPDALKRNASIIGDVIKYPSFEGVISVLEDVAQKDTLLEKVSNFNNIAKDEEKRSLAEFLCECKCLSSSAKDVLQKLELFANTDNLDMDTTIEQINLLEPADQLVVPYPEVYLRCIPATTAALSQLLDARQVTRDEVTLNILILMANGDNKYNRNDVKVFMLHLLKECHFFTNQAILKLAKRIQFLTTDEMSEQFRVCDLFEPQPELCKLFEREDKFPAAEFMDSSLLQGLKMLGLKTVTDVTDEHLCRTGAVIESLLGTNEFEVAARKGKALFAFLKARLAKPYKNSLKSLLQVRFVPRLVRRTTGYPVTLRLFGEENSCLLERLGNVWNEKHLNVIGSVSPVANLPKEIISAFQLVSEPPLHQVLEHMDLTIASYQPQQDTEHKYMEVMKDLYRYLSKQNVSLMTKACKERLRKMKFIWINSEFHFASQIWTMKSQRKDIELKPYRFCLPKFWIGIADIVEAVGGQKQQSPEMLVSVLKEIQHKHLQARMDNSDDMQEDLQIIFHIINMLKSYKFHSNEISLPIHQDEYSKSLVLKSAADCTFCNAEWLLEQTTDGEEEEKLYFVHSDISEETARYFGASLLTERVMEGTEAFDLNCGQHESLTKRLNGILRGYTDGFSVPKEIIQNAEDAKATKVMFLYDERHNSSARTSLMNKGMESLQGPALWSYNDAQFTEDDFLNIQDLGGATKEDDATKLGRFGLGFNSVYNLTDVPSFISGNTVVIFDPHRTYLGRPGLKADLSSVKNKRMLQTMRGQFQPFDGVFGCDIGQKAKGDICKGTLFRFPLRTAEQAEKSEIKHLHYSKSEMKTFLEILVKGAGNLLLYTQNVKLMEVYYLPNGASVDKCELLFSVQKKTDDQFSVFNQAKVPHNPQINTLSHFSKQCNMDSREDYLIERVNVSVKTTTEFSNSFGIKVHQDNTNWQITWSMGKTVPGQFATIKGLLPLASTAVPLSTSGDIIQMSSLRECQSFFCVGHLYCFLPLPLPSTQFAMHINAQFALTEDRRRLCEKTEDDKTSIPGSWNKHLETEVISRTIICTLTGLENLTQNDVEAYYNLWPGVMLNKDVDVKNSLEKPAIVTSFYKVITEEEYKVFLQGDPVNYVAFKNSIFLSPSLAYNEFIGKTAVGVLQRFWEKDTVIDLPERIYQNFISAGLTETFNSRVVSTEDFYKEVFLPNIELVNSSDRQSLTLYAVKLCVPNIDALLKMYECIPSKPNGKLRKPKELVHPRGKVSQLFTESEEIFPSEAFERHEILKQLCCLGMVENDLPWEAIIGRIETVQDLSLEDNTRAEKRCLNILQYINEYDSSTRGRRFHKCGEDARQQISTMAFLPVLQKARDWPFKWKGDTVSVFSTPVQLFFHEEADLVGCCNLLLDSYKLDGLFSLKEVLIWLGVQDTKSVTATVVCEQLLHISTQILRGVQLSKESIKILNNLYKHLDALCKEVDSTSPEHDIIAKLKGKQVILNDKMLVFPQQVAFHLEYDLHPYLYQIEPTQRFIYKHFLQVIGIKEHFDVDCVKEQIDKTAETYKDIPMRKEDVTLYVNMANLLYKLSAKENCVNSELWQMFLPDTENSLKPATDLCLDDCSRLKKDSGIQIVHPSISKEVALHFKVKTLIHASVEKVLLPWSATSFGQREKLTTRLKGILEGYPRDSSIMKELLQNADDAGATELKFIKDFRNHPTENVFSDNWKPLQGPALCVWNNSSFTEKDFEGIQSLGVGSKSDDALKTGQYGVGFNAVYHLTDVPSFFTVGPETPETVCFLDPNLKYIPWATSEAPGCRFPAAELQCKFQDIFKCYLTDVIDFGESGTLFRLPLRTNEMVSDISDEEIPIEGKMGIEQLLKDFRNEMSESLLFLHNIKNISIHSVMKDGRLVEDFSVSAEISEQHAGLKNYVSGLRTYVKHKEQDVTKQTKVVLKVKSLEGKQERWLVVHKCGFADNTKVPEILKECQRDGKIGMLPRGGVAIPLDDNTVQGKAFCMLPLRITTKLPVHINGHFALDHEARGNLWHGPHPFRTLWNEAIIQQVIVPAYVSGLETLIGPELLGAQQDPGYFRSHELLKPFINLFPVIAGTSDDYWKLLATCFYRHIVQHYTALFPVIKPLDGKFSENSRSQNQTRLVKFDWVSVASSTGFPGYFNNIPVPAKKVDSTAQHVKVPKLVEILKDLGMKIIDMPLSIYHQFQEADLEVSCISSDSVIEFLKSFTNSNEDRCQLASLPLDIKSTPLKDTHALTVLTKYCKESSTFLDSLDGLPLLLTQDSILRCFTSQLPIIVTVFTELIKGSPGMAMHRSMEQLYSGFTDKSDTLRKLDIQTLSTLLSDTMGHIISTVPIPWECSGKPSPQWILEIWDFLHREIVASSKMTPHIDSVKSSLSSLSQVCILPAKVTEKFQTVIYLFPICDSDKILDLLGMTNMTYKTAFSKLSVPQLDFGETASNNEECVKSAKTLVANLQRPASTLKALAQHTHKLIGIKEGSAKILQQYFCTHLKDLQTLEIPVATELLRSLPIYEDLSGSCQHMKMARVYAVIEHDNIPQDGIETWSLGLKTCLLKCSDSNKNLFEFLKVQILSPEELYEKIILEKFSHLPKPTQAVHLQYVRDHLLKTSFLSNYSSVQKNLIQCLKRLHFIEDKDGSLHRACEYYLKRGTLFAEFLSEDKFPPPPYDSPEWETFLKESGIVIKVSEKDFEKFARSVEDMNVTPITRDVEHKSKLLTKHLFEKQEGLMKGLLLSRVKNIKFVMPYNMEKESNEKDMTKRILPQFQQGKLITYGDSVSSKHCHYIWTSCAMFPHYADPDYYKNGHSRKDREKMALLLGIKKEPSIESVVQHIVNISTSLEQRQQTRPHRGSDLVVILTMVLKSIYTFLQDNTSNLTEKLKKQLKAAFVVFLPQEGLFVRPSQVVLEVSGTDTMQGIYKAPVEFGPYFKLFSLLGAAPEVTTNHYAEVLQVLAQTTADGKLEPNELKIVQKATDMLFKCLQKEEKDNNIALTVQYLFLLDRDGKLSKSTSLVIADNESLENRVKTLNFRYFVGFKRLEISKTNEVDVFEQLPEIYRPKILDQMTNEVMCETSHNKATEGSVSSEYSQKITNPEFVIGLIRLINDSRRLGRVEKLTETELKNIEMKLANMSIKQITGLKTVLIHGGLVVEGSDREQSCFLDYEDENKVTVYINTRKLNQVLLHSKLATAINKLTGGYITSGLYSLVDMLACDPGKIQAYLDGMSVQPTSYICSYIKDSVFPPPGTRIPEEFHWMLDNSFTRFDVEEYVGMEIYDPLTDDRIGQEGSDLPNPDSGPVYIYAKVKQILTSETLPILDRYAVDVGEEGIQEVSALDLFKFQRQKRSQCREIVLSNRSQHDEGNTPGPETETGEVPRKEQQATPSEDKPLDMDSVLKEIRETLKVAWQMPDTKQREKVKKRLLFKWHPDKNQGNEEFCTKVFQRIQNYIEMLEKGQNIDQVPGHTNAKPRTERSNWFYEEMNRRSKRHRHDYEHFWDDDGDSFSHGFHSRSGGSSFRAHHREKPNPQPEEARRWMRQAREDLRVARETMHTLSAYNWSCFQCYMACDKAVKALLYYRDAKEGDEQRTHDLSLVVYKLKDKSMRDMVYKLLSIVQNTSHAQYPKKLKFPYIPAETFSHTNAREACDISERVLQRAGELIG
ncbi:sacsin-like [Haliotis rufescens]|uniref:sacsin-like n=1 Tax=Haliotis rufescens TaxID=6454 RepID=UPI00201E7602|nr:sacsin-like [Haliotis rufescens]